MTRLLSLVALLVVGCSKPAEVGPLEVPTVAIEAMPTPSSVAATTEAVRDLALPISKDDVLAAIKAKGYELEVVDPPEKQPNATYCIAKDTEARIVMIERGGKLRGIMIGTSQTGDKAKAERTIELVEAVTMAVLKFDAYDARNSVAGAAIDALGDRQKIRSRFIGFGSQDVIVAVDRGINDGVGYTFMPNPIKGF